ncbi:hypothetical protein PLESTM_001107400 [Pleodorina starrii]|nr:hypothetical protein PLESTM_001107400 [Pleodorina starrii]
MKHGGHAAVHSAGSKRQPRHRHGERRGNSFGGAASCTEMIGVLGVLRMLGAPDVGMHAYLVSSRRAPGKTYPGCMLTGPYRAGEAAYCLPMAAHASFVLCSCAFL